MSTSSDSRAPTLIRGAAWRGNASRAAMLGLVVFLVTGTIGWRLSQSHEEKLHADEQTKVRNRLNGLSTSLASVLHRRQGLVGGISAFAELHAAEPAIREKFALYAAGLKAGDPVIRFLQLFPPDGPVLIHPFSTRDAGPDRTLQDLLQDDRPQVRVDVQRTIDSRATTISDPYELRQARAWSCAKPSFGPARCGAWRW
jgi:hypothetical protein